MELMGCGEGCIGKGCTGLKELEWVLQGGEGNNYGINCFKKVFNG